MHDRIEVQVIEGLLNVAAVDEIAASEHHQKGNKKEAMFLKKRAERIFGEALRREATQ